MSKTYGLYPWSWRPPVDGEPGCYTPPDGAVSVLDFRREGEQSVPNVEGQGFFSWTGEAPSDIVSLGVGDCREIQPTTADRNNMRQALGLSASPSGATLVDCISDILGPLSDPSGQSGPKPVMPDSFGELSIHLTNHSKVWSLRMVPSDLLKDKPNKRYSNVRDVVRSDIDKAIALGGPELGEKVLGGALLGLGYSREELREGASGKKTEWSRLLSANAKKQVKGPREPRTSFTETWPTDCADIGSTPQDRSWETLAVTNWPKGIRVDGNKCQGSGGEGFHFGRCLPAVSSANHIVSGILHTGGGAVSGGVASRMNGSGVGTCYFYGNRFNVVNVLRKSVAGTFTDLAQQNASGLTQVFSIAMRSNGSTQTGTTSLWPSDVVTDTSITGNPYGGVFHYVWTALSSLSASKLDDWLLDDELVAGGPFPFYFDNMTGGFQSFGMGSL